MGKLTTTKIEKHSPIKDDEILADGSGLYLRFRKGRSGKLSRIWMYTYKSGTKSVYLTLGEHGSTLSDFDAAIYGLAVGSGLTLANARVIAVKATDWRKAGSNPKDFIQNEIDRRVAVAAAQVEAEVSRKKQIETENLTVADLFLAWLTNGVRRKDGNAELQRSFDKDVLPEIGYMAVRSVTEHDIRAVLRKMVDRGVNRLAVVTCGNLTQMFLWAEKRQPWRKLLTEGNPVQLIEIEKIVSPEYDISNERERRLSVDEILELQRKFDIMQIEYDGAKDKRIATRPVEKTTELAIWLMLSTICRVGELSMSRWEHVNLESGEWFIPRQNTKGSKGNQSDLMVYLSPFSHEQFRRLREVTGDSEWCFPAKHKDGHVCVKSMTKQIGDRQAMFKKGRDGNARQPMKNRRNDNSLVLGGGENDEWTPHDLRRTGATMMQSLGVSLEIIDRCQNHVLPGSKVRRHYLHHDYAAEKREAWSLLGDRLSLILNPADNVVKTT
jgi:integrase